MEFLFNNWLQFTQDLNLALNYIIFVFILQVGLMFFRQWYYERKKNIKNDFILGFALYFLFFSASLFILFHFTYFYSLITREVFEIWFFISILIRGLAAILFSIFIEKRIQRDIRTRYVFTITMVTLLVLSPLFIFIQSLNQLMNIFTVLYAIIPMIATIYFIFNAKIELRKKLIFGLLGIFLVLGTLTFVSDHPYKLTSLFIDLPIQALIIFKIIMVAGACLIMYAFHDYNFFLTSHWKSNLVSLFIIDKKTGYYLYAKHFLEKEIKDEGQFSGGISGIVKLIQNFSETEKDIDNIQVQDKLIMMDHGNHVITAVIIKKELLDVKLILKEITRKFEIYFKDNLEKESFDSDVKSRLQKFKPIENIVYDLIEF